MAARRRFLSGAAIAAVLFAGLALLAVNQACASSAKRPVEVSWAGVPFRRAVMNLGQAHGVTVMVDRRVDPEMPLEMSLEAKTVDQAFEQIAAQNGLGVSRLGRIVYIGPRQATDRLRTLAELRREDARESAARLREKLFAQRPLRWDTLAVPREILQQLARQERLDLTGLDRVPHDLWPAMEFPSLPLVDRLSVVLNGFDLSFQAIGEQGIEIVQIQEPVVLERRYRGGGPPDETQRLPRPSALEARWDAASREWVLRGRLEDHEDFLSALTPAQVASNSSKKPPRNDRSAGKRQNRAESTSRYTLSAKNQPLRLVIRYLSEQLKLQFQLPGNGLPQETLDRLITLDVREVTMDELLRAAFEPAGLDFTREGLRVELEESAKE